MALVTGGTSGIGEAAALALARDGAKVVVAGRRENEGQAVVDAIIKGAAKRCLASKRTSAARPMSKALVDKTVATFGRLDFAINNAGIEGAGGLTMDQQTEERITGTHSISPCLGFFLA